MGEITSYHDLKYDDSTKTLTVIDFVHHEQHEGDHYEAFIQSPVLGDGDAIEMYFKAPTSSVQIHLVAEFSGELAGRAELREGAAVSASGTVVTAFNNFRSSSNAATAVVRSSPTLTGSGTLLPPFKVGGGFQSRDGGSGGSRREWILLQGTIYILRYTSDAADNEADIVAAWYEHTPS